MLLSPERTICFESTLIFLAPQDYQRIDWTGLPQLHQLQPPMNHVFILFIPPLRQITFYNKLIIVQLHVTITPLQQTTLAKLINIILQYL